MWVSADRGYTAIEPMSLSLLGLLGLRHEWRFIQEWGIFLDETMCVIGLSTAFEVTFYFWDWLRPNFTIKKSQSMLYFWNRQGCFVCLEETSLCCTTTMSVIFGVFMSLKLATQRLRWGLIWLWSSFDNTENIKHEVHCIMEAELHILMTLPPALF